MGCYMKEDEYARQLVVRDFTTTIQIQKSTRDRLKTLGRKDETYDNLVNRLIEGYVAFTQGE